MNSLKTTLGKKSNSILVAAIGIGLLNGLLPINSVFASSTFKLTAHPSESKSVTRVYPATVEGHAVINPATMSVRFRVHNTGSLPITPSCTLSASDPSGTYHGFDIFTPKSPIAAGASIPLVGRLTITKQGANYANQFKIKCTAVTTDTAISTGKSVTIVSVTNCGDSYGAYDDTVPEWYWGACIKASKVAPFTHMRCVETAFNSSGKVLTSHAFNATTLNDLSVTGYGEKETTMPSTTKAVAKAITNVKVKCVLN
jgi:hypothetical protein